jgi:hypothetical protein
VKGEADFTEGSPPASARDEFRLSDGEVHFLWWFIQGSIMSPFTRQRLRRAWGMCERHAWGFISVDAAYRHGWLHGPAVLYEDLMGRALALFDLKGPMKHRRIAGQLKEKELCLMCDSGFGPRSRGMANPAVIEAGRDLGHFRAFAMETKRYWEGLVCGRCAGDDSPQRCRPHLIEDASLGLVEDLSPHRALVSYVARHVVKYSRSFRWELRGTDTQEDRASLMSAVGWCSGWGILLRVLEQAGEDDEKGPHVSQCP